MSAILDHVIGRGVTSSTINTPLNLNKREGKREKNNRILEIALFLSSLHCLYNLTNLEFLYDNLALLKSELKL